MKKRILYFSLLVYFLFFLGVSIIFSQTPAPSQRWVCLLIKNGNREEHTATLSVDPNNRLLPNSQTFFVECLPVPGNNQQRAGQICTTGNSNLDIQIFNQDNLAELRRIHNYEFQGMSIANPTTSDNNGTVRDFTWKSYTPQEIGRRFLAVNFFTPAPTVVTNQSGDNTQKLGTFDFSNVVNRSDCQIISWDPYGRVFDAKTLEPIAKARVTLERKDSQGNYRIVTPGGDIFAIVNPQFTREDGFFNFVVPDGDYRLQVEAEGYEFPVIERDEINQNFNLIYTNIYPSQTGEEIRQRGKIEQRDIPLRLKPGFSSQDNRPKIMEYFHDLDKQGSRVIIKGRSSHPFSIIRAYSLRVKNRSSGVNQGRIDSVRIYTESESFSGSNDIERYRLLTNQNNSTSLRTDKNGNFTLIVNTFSFEEGEFFGLIEVSKTDLTKSENLINRSIKNVIGRFFKTTLAQQNSSQQNLSSVLKLEPIFNYLEGYAYDENNKPISKAKVTIKLPFSQKPYFEIEADEKGYYSIPSEFLPSMPYDIIYQNPITKERVFVDKVRLISQSVNSGKRTNFYDYKISTLSAASRIAKESDNLRNNRKRESQENNLSRERSQSLAENLNPKAQQKPINQTNNPIVLLLLTVFGLFLVISGVLAVVYFTKQKQNNL
ncbi:MAG: carboxypeptidase-like regulatory domain-containing protein [Patescibacteria group bacterium]|nr:carboxypeptidase-like regulatory domain-containing protein [Patescibacteria group bacterium]